MVMYPYPRTVRAVLTFAVGLSLAGCSAGITTASSRTSPSASASRPGSSPAAPPSRSALPSPSVSPSASAAGAVKLSAPAGSFPVPPGAQVLANDSCPKQVFVMLGPVKPSQASVFYTRALPRAGYSITSNMLTSDPGDGAPNGMLILDFTGHGYTGTIIGADDLSSDASAAPSMGSFSGALSKNVVEVIMSPPGTPESYTCPGD